MSPPKTKPLPHLPPTVPLSSRISSLPISERMMTSMPANRRPFEGSAAVPAQSPSLPLPSSSSTSSTATAASTSTAASAATSTAPSTAPSTSNSTSTSSNTSISGPFVVERPSSFSRSLFRKPRSRMYPGGTAYMCDECRLAFAHWVNCVEPAGQVAVHEYPFMCVHPGGLRPYAPAVQHGFAYGHPGPAVPNLYRAHEVVVCQRSIEERADVDAYYRRERRRLCPKSLR